ncbi:MAG: M50 family metallopeptidase [Candidatus Saccharimonadaceae bacterium]|nr:M50 family metallopeptidase [Candidatus Saccharimonadaceae bacterium]
MELIFGIFVGLIILVILVVVHELGHAVAARRNGVVVEEFGIGLPPTGWGKKLKNGVLFTLNWLPLGGYVKLQGEHDAAKKKGDYGAATFWQKTKILFAGVASNWLVAGLLLSVLAVTGLPKVLPNQFSIANDTTTVRKPVEIVYLISGHAAEKAGFKEGDTIIRFAGKEVPTSESMIDLAKQNKGKTVEIIYDRDGVEYDKKVKLGNDVSSGVFGAGLGQREFIKATWSAPVVGFGTTVQFTIVTFQGLGDLLYNLASGLVSQLSPDAGVRADASSKLKTVSEGVAGPIGIIGTLFPSAEKAGPTQLTLLTAIVSLTLAVMNVLPIPSLDGGRWFTTFLFRLFRKKLTKEREEKIQMVGFSILMGLIILVTFVDVAKLL